MKKYNVVKQHHNHRQGKPRYPSKNRNHPQRNNRQRPNSLMPAQVFQGNIVKNMRFGGKVHDLSGYVERTVNVKDRYGNLQVAKERQFYNSSREGLNIKIKDENNRNR